AYRTYLFARFRSRFEHGGGVHRAASAKAGSRIHRDGSQPGLPDEGIVMKGLRSFRSRILLGTLLWTVGLIPMLHLLFLLIHRQMRLVPHDALPVFFVFSLLFIALGVWQFRAWLLPFGHLRRHLSGLRDGS